MPVKRRGGWHERAWAPEYVEAATTWAYAIANGAAVKLGKTTCHPRQRLDDLQTASSAQLALVGYTAHVGEARLHKLLHGVRLLGEWFRICPRVLDACATSTSWTRRSSDAWRRHV